MEFHHHHHQRDDGDEDRQSFRPPPPNNNFTDAPPPPSFHHSHTHFDPYAPTPASAPFQPEPQFDPYAPTPASAPFQPEPLFDPYAPPQPYFEAPSPPPSFAHVSHVSHNTSNEPYPPYFPTDVTHVSHHSSSQPQSPFLVYHRPNENRLPNNLSGLIGRSTVKVYSKAEPNYTLTIRDGKVILAPSDPSDVAQHWYKNEKYSTQMKDADGHPCFALVNKATGEAMKHSVGATHPVQLIRYDPNRLDESVLWTESKDLGDGYCTIRMVNNVRLNVDACHSDNKSGGVRDIVLWDSNESDSQRWKIVGGGMLKSNCCVCL